MVNCYCMMTLAMGPFKCYLMQWGWEGGIRISAFDHYEGVQSNVISVTMEWGEGVSNVLLIKSIT